MLFATNTLLLLLAVPILLLAVEYFIAKKAVSPYPGLVIPCLLGLSVIPMGPVALPPALLAFLLYFWQRSRRRAAAKRLTEEERSRLEDL